jgi:hypothetical protein
MSKSKEKSKDVKATILGFSFSPNSIVLLAQTYLVTCSSHIFTIFFYLLQKNTRKFYEKEIVVDSEFKIRDLMSTI